MILRNILRLNWRATIGINRRIGGWRCVLRMPVKVYGKLLWRINGDIILPEGAIRNTLIIGSEHEDYTASAGKAELRIDGTWRIGGIVRIGHDVFVGVERGATLSIGDGSFIGRDTQIHCSHSITIEHDVFAGEAYMCDSTVHQLISNGRELQRMGEITIGHDTYLGFRTMLLKGAVIPPHSVVASGALCNKDYTAAAPSAIMLAGVPATVKATGISAIK